MASKIVTKFNEIQKVKETQPVLFNNLINKVIKVGDVSVNCLMEILENETTPPEVKISLAGGVLKQVLEFLTLNNKK